MNREQSREMLRSFFPEAGKPFLVELELVPSETETETDSAIALMSSMMSGRELIPGVKVAKCYRQAETVGSVVVGGLNEQSIDLFNNVLKNIENARNSLKALENALRRQVGGTDREKDS
jgi:hypothetical protein